MSAKGKGRRNPGGGKGRKRPRVDKGRDIVKEVTLAKLTLILFEVSLY